MYFWNKTVHVKALGNYFSFFSQYSLFYFYHLSVCHQLSPLSLFLFFKEIFFIEYRLSDSAELKVTWKVGWPLLHSATQPQAAWVNCFGLDGPSSDCCLSHPSVLSSSPLVLRISVSSQIQVKVYYLIFLIYTSWSPRLRVSHYIVHFTLQVAITTLVKPTVLL